MLAVCRDESKRKQEPQEKEAELSELEQQSARQSTMLANEKRLLEERERARQVLLLLDLKEQRRRDGKYPVGYTLSHVGQVDL